MRRGIRGLSALLLFAMVALAGAPSSVVAGEQTPDTIVSYETIYGSLDPDGSLRNMRLVNQLRVHGDGDFLIVDPSATENFRNLSGTGSARMRDGAIEWSVEGVSGTAELLSSTTPDVPPPLEMQVTYYLDGERVEGSTLPGKRGRVQMVFDVTNTTSVPMEVTYEDGTGNETTVTENVPIPMVAELTLELPKGIFTEVEAPGADVVTNSNGDLTVRWSMVLAPPVGNVAQSFSLTASTEGFALGGVQLMGAPVEKESREFVAYAGEDLGADAESAASLYGGSSELASNIDRLHDGAVKLLDGMQQLFDGSKELQEGLLEGAGRVSSGLGEAASGSSRLTQGIGDAQTGSSQITGGLQELGKGMRRILKGMKTLAKGLPDAQGGAQQIAQAAQALDGALGAVRTGLQTAQAGAGQIQAGAHGIQAIAAGLAANLGDVATGAAGISGIANTVGPPLQAAAALCDLDPDCADIVTAMLSAHACLVGGPAACGGNPDINTIAGGIAAGVAGIQACLTGGGLPCAGNPSVNAIAGGIAGGAGDLVAGLGTAVAGIGLPTDAAQASIRGGLNAMRLGALQLAAGIGDAIAGVGNALTDNTLIGGMTSATAGVDALTAGSARLTSGLSEAHSGAGQLTSGLNTAARDIPAGMNEAADGAGRINEGLGDAKDGAQQIEQNLYLVNEVGVREIARSASAKVAEINRQLGLLEAQEERAASEAVLYGPPSSDQAETVIGGSSVVLTLDGLDARSMASTARGVGAGVALVLLAGIGLALGTFRRRSLPAA